MERDYAKEVGIILSENLRTADKIERLKMLLEEHQSEKETITKALKEVQSAEEPFKYMVGKYYRNDDVYCKVIDLGYSNDFYSTKKDCGICITVCTKEGELFIGQDENRCGCKPLRDECEISAEEFIQALKKTTTVLHLKATKSNAKQRR